MISRSFLRKRKAKTMSQPKSEPDEPDLVNQMFFIGLFYALMGYQGEADNHFRWSLRLYKVKRHSFWS